MFPVFFSRLEVWAVRRNRGKYLDLKCHSPSPLILYKRILSPSPCCWDEGCVEAKGGKPSALPALKFSCITGHRSGRENTGSRRAWEHNPVKEEKQARAPQKRRARNDRSDRPRSERPAKDRG